MESPQSPHSSSLWVFALSAVESYRPLPPVPISRLGTKLFSTVLLLFGLRVISPDHSAVSSRQGLTQSDGHTKASDALPDSRADIPFFGQSLLTVPDQTRAVTHRDRMAHLGLALRSPNSLRSRKLAKYEIQYL